MDFFLPTIPFYPDTTGISPQKGLRLPLEASKLANRERVILNLTQPNEKFDRKKVINKQSLPSNLPLFVKLLLSTIPFTVIPSKTENIPQKSLQLGLEASKLPDRKPVISNSCFSDETESNMYP